MSLDYSKPQNYKIIMNYELIITNYAFLAIILFQLLEYKSHKAFYLLYKIYKSSTQINHLDSEYN